MNPNFKTLATSTLLLVLLAACSTPISPGAEQPSSPVVREATLKAPGYPEAVRVRYQELGGTALFEGDIILRKGSAEPGAEDSVDAQGFVTEFLGRTWTGGIIPYTINSNVTAAGRQHIEEAIEHWEANTLIDFIPWQGSAVHYNYVEFARGQGEEYTNACASNLGMIGGKQHIYLTTSGDCAVGTLIHEIGHTVGLLHEHTRPDRDQHIKINYENIPDDWEFAFDRISANPYEDGKMFGSYDHGSVMHYGNYWFCLKVNGACQGQTIETIPAGIEIGQREGLSDGDKAAMRKLYPSTRVWYNNFYQLDSEIRLLRNNKWALQEINGHLHAGEAMFSTRWVKSLGNWNGRAKVNMTASEYSAFVSSFWADGYRPIHVDGYTLSDGTPRFAAVLHRAVNAISRINMTPQEYQGHAEAYASQGYRLKNISGYTSNGSLRYAATWVLAPNWDFYSNRAMTRSTFESTHTQKTAAGYVLSYLDAFVVSGQVYFAAIWDRASNITSVYLSQADATNTYNMNYYFKNQGYVLVHATQYTLNGTNYFPQVFQKYTNQ